MSALEAFLAGPAGPAIAILLMALATFACRASGVLIMSRMRLTPRIERALRALPGSIVLATVLPIAAEAGTGAAAGLVVTIAVMALTRIELAAIGAGLGTVALARLMGA